MRKLAIVLFLLLVVAGCETYSPPELTATAAVQTPPVIVVTATPWASNTPIPTDWPTAEATEFPYYYRGCVEDAINLNACLVPQPYADEPYDTAIEIRPLEGDDWPDGKLARVVFEDGQMVYDVTGPDGGFTGDIVLIFDRSENAPQFEYEPGDCLAVNVSLTSDFGGVPVRRFVDGVNVGGETQLWMWLKIVLDNGEVIEHGRTWDFSDRQEPSPSLNGHREFYWVFWSLDGARAIEEIELGYHQNSAITGPGNDVAFDWVNFHTIDGSQCGNSGPLW